jgi:hypothetical protein
MKGTSFCLLTCSVYRMNKSIFTFSYMHNTRFIYWASAHMLLNILAGFTYNIMTSGVIFFIVGLIPLSFIIAFSGLELGIALIQAQVFVVLTSGYIKDALDLY